MNYKNNSKESKMDNEKLIIPQERAGISKVLKLIRSTGITDKELKYSKDKEKLDIETLIKIEYNNQFFWKSSDEINIYDFENKNIIIGKWNKKEQKINFLEDIVKKLEDFVKI